jgi:putative cell wall-binding protein
MKTRGFASRAKGFGVRLHHFPRGLAATTIAVVIGVAAGVTAMPRTASAATVDAGKSTVVANPATPGVVLANGVSTATVTVTVKDASSATIADVNVVLAKGADSSVISPSGAVATDASGVATFRVTDTVAEDVTYTATAGATTLTATATVSFQAPAPLGSKSTVTANPSSVVNNGVATSTITVTVNDADGVPLAGQTVELSPDAGSSTISAASGVSGADGVVTFTVKDTAHETVTYSATIDPGGEDVHVVQTAQVTFAPASPPVTTLPTLTPTRLAGDDRFGTAIAESQVVFPTPGSAGAVIITRSDDYADALVGAPLAVALHAPILLADGGELTPATTAEIQRVLLPGKTVYILGSTDAVPASVETTLGGLGYHVVRYFGADRYGTALAVAQALGNPGTVLLATGTNFPDALAAGSAAAQLGAVVLLTNGSTLPPSIQAYLQAYSNLVYAIGGPAATADPLAAALAGADRYGTAALVANTFFPPLPTLNTLGIVNGTTFADALSGGAFEALLGGPLLLSPFDALPPATSDYLGSLGTLLLPPSILGGDQALSQGVQQSLTDLLGS